MAHPVRKGEKPKGHWITTDDDQHVFISGKGEFLPRGPGTKPRSKGGAHHQTPEGKARTAELVAKARGAKGAKSSGPLTEPWKHSADQYQAAKGVHQPWIAEISPFQYARMGKQQKAAYDAKRTKEWDASTNVKREHRAAVIEAFKAGKITHKTEGISQDAKRAILGEMHATKKAGKEAKRKAVDERRTIRSPSEVKPGQTIETTMYGKVKVGKVNRATVSVQGKFGSVSLPLKEGGPAYAKRTETPGRAAEVVAKARAAQAKPSPPKPGLKEQAAAHRAGKGDVEKRAHAIAAKHIEFSKTATYSGRKEVRVQVGGMFTGKRFTIAQATKGGKDFNINRNDYVEGADGIPRKDKSLLQQHGSLAEAKKAMVAGLAESITKRKARLARLYQSRQTP